MAQIDPRDLDYSPMMIEFFAELVKRLQERGIDPAEAERRVGRFFERQASPLERALVMHRGVERVVDALLSDSGN
ncbi:hypothetical protein [Rhizobium azibense]|uniref:Uncharacterized protein n=1 Tax=Rhizobium azibense TaxID=1136135 RepID=A0A4R3RF21_9HYPH|nr:hypothetical protein [Rhizobium azibense]TCU33144.1 hypothetical protein EV129_117141 [Rhizobium azibense]